MMNILFDISVLGIGNSFSHTRTGIYRVVENLALGLDSRVDGCSTTFCASHGNYNDCKDYLTLNERVFTSSFSQPDTMLTSIYNSIQPLRIEVAKLSQHSWKIPFRKIYHFGRKFLYPIAHSDISLADIYHSPAHPIPDQINQNLRIKKFITIHDLVPLLYPEYCDSFTPEYMNKILNSISADTFISCVSEATKNDLLSYLPSLDTHKVSVAPLAAGNHFYPCKGTGLVDIVKAKYDIPAEEEYFLALSTLQPRKNFERIINSFVELLSAEKIRKLNLVLVGANGWNYEKIYKEIENAGRFKNSIRLIGYVPDEDLAPLYSGALAFLYPSLYEGFGLPPLEAMQCGTPVITSNISSLPEVVGESAITIDPKDGDALCQAMLSLYTSHALREKLSVASIERARRFNWDRTINDTVTAYRRACS